MNNYHFYFVMGSTQLTKDNIELYREWIKNQHNVELWVDDDCLLFLNEIKNVNLQDAWFKYPELSSMKILYRHKDLWIFHRWQDEGSFEESDKYDSAIVRLNEEGNVKPEYDLAAELEEVQYELWCSGDRLDEEDLYCDEFIDDFFTY